ncbi:MAG TPA: septal ring lytic transglycosylase RlpA family protein [Solirubrobacteraceae bacterium]|jgi:rare lipoprotein A (peptidoglycan hydrolase)|nr:septal ring lytic transglycosylase RlpA family protein [Solirubrobacteraceae bacterium]
MRFGAKTATVVLTLLTGLLVLAMGAAVAMASTGGASAPVTGTPASTTAAKTVHPTGIATWFGPGFYGKKTACGQTLTPGVVGVANRTLPCGTLIKVAYGSHTLTIPVLDRGPYSHIGADWDLTAGAAHALGITETVRIKTKVVGIAANSPTLGLPPVSPVAPAAVLAGGASAG